MRATVTFLLLTSLRCIEAHSESLSLGFLSGQTQSCTEVTVLIPPAGHSEAQNEAQKSDSEAQARRTAYYTSSMVVFYHDEVEALTADSECLTC
jgi:hypothetical protein